MVRKFKFQADQQYEEFADEVLKYENEIEEHAKSDYDWSITDNAIIQITLIVASRRSTFNPNKAASSP
jgi:hypothetical protein